MTRIAWVVPGLAVVLGGCLPSSQRENDRSVSAADSASTAIAEVAPVDTLAVVWAAEPPADDPLPVASTVHGVGDGFAVVETLQGSVRLFDAGGAYRGRIDVGAESFPYGAGARGDTVVVLARGADELRWVVPGAGVVRTLAVPDGATAALPTPDRLVVRVGGGPGDTDAPGVAPALVVLAEDGTERARHPIVGRDWRAVGLLRAWDGALLALSGYRPVVDVLPAGADRSASLDTLALEGFGSPQLVRSAQFDRGEVKEPPLLTSSADPLGDRLYVLNLRDDHVRIDVYDRDGALERVLVSPGPWRPSAVVAVDLAARPGPGGAVDLVVLLARAPGLMQEPESRLVRYRWRPPVAG